MPPLRQPSSPTLLVVGCGDIGMRVLRLLRGRWRLLALTSSAGRCEALRQAGAVPLLGNLDRPTTLARLGEAFAALVYATAAVTGAAAWWLDLRCPSRYKDEGTRAQNNDCRPTDQQVYTRLGVLSMVGS